MRDFRFSWSKL